MTTTYTSTDLPPFKPGTSGTARPKPGADVAVCVAPKDATIKRPASWGAGQALEIKAGTHHIAQDGAGDSYPNQEFATFYVEGDSLDAATDPRAAFLVGFWAANDASVEVSLARKTRHATVLGVVADEAAGATFQNHEGTTTLEPGSRILQSPDDEIVRWAIASTVFAKKYLPTESA